jgi:hypothetical protein
MGDAAPTLGQKLKKTLVKWTVVSLLVAVLGTGLWVWGSLAYVYSKGERAGFVQKFSKRGWVIKTWEGELAMVNLPGAMPEIFPFTVRDETVAKEMEKAIGARVAITYEEHRALPGRLFGDTNYFVVNVRPVDAAGTP